MSARLFWLVFILFARTILAQPGVEEALRRGAALEDSGKVEQAVEVYRSLYLQHAKGGERSDLLYRLQGALVRAGRAEEAVPLLQQRLNRFPSDSRAQLALGDVYYAMGRAEEAARAWERLIEGERPAGNYLLVASRYRARGRPERAVDVYVRGRRAVGDTTAFALELAGLYEEQRNYPEAVREYLLALRADPQENPPRNYATVEARVAEFARDEGAGGAVLAALTEGVRAAPEDGLRMQLLTAYSLAAGKADAALAVFAALGRRDGAAEAMLLQIAERCSRGGAHATALAAYRMLIERFPSSPFLPQAHLGAAVAEEGLGRIDPALALYEEVRGRFPGGPEAQAACFRVGEVRRRVKRDPEGALAAYRGLMAIQLGGPYQRQGMMGIGACLLSLGDAEGARRSYELVARMGPGSEEGAEAALRVAEVDYLSGRFEEAQRGLEALLGGPTARDAVNDALDLSDLIARGLGVSASYLKGYAEADLLARRGRDEEAVRAFEGFVAGSPRGPLAARALMAVARLDTGLGRFAEAAEVCRRVAQEYQTSPLAPEARMQAAALYEERLGRFQEAVGEYEALMTEYPDSPLVEEARQRLRRLQERIRG
ncbi:tetratricopeptide repeat protein [bacterium]|nr:tetratricopeptide repeat protein [bacterium]